MVTPEFAVLFPGSEVMFYCNTTQSSALWMINGENAPLSDLPPGVRIVNVTTMIVNMSANASTYTCSVLITADLVDSNAAILVLAG